MRFYPLADEPFVCKGKVKKQGCASNESGDYNECRVPAISQILNVTVHNQIKMSTPCVFTEDPIPTDWPLANGGVCGFSGDTIIVAGGCRAVFEICYSGKIWMSLHTYKGSCELTQRARNVYATTHQRRFNILRLFRRWYDIASTSRDRWEHGADKYYRTSFIRPNR